MGILKYTPVDRPTIAETLMTGTGDSIDHERTPHFTGRPLPISEPMARQSIRSPQGLAAVTDPDWALNDESERFLEAIFSDP